MRTPLFLVLVAFTATSAAAHDTWLVRATRLERASGPDADWRSWFATLTFALRR